MTEEEEAERARRARRRRQAVIQLLEWIVSVANEEARRNRLVKEIETVNKYEIVRETTAVDSGSWFLQGNGIKQQVVAGGQDEVQKAFADLMASVTPFERLEIQRDIRRRKIATPTSSAGYSLANRPALVDTPETRAAARALFAF